MRRFMTFTPPPVIGLPFVSSAMPEIFDEVTGRSAMLTPLIV
jgi:hypothetical protein